MNHRPVRAVAVLALSGLVLGGLVLGAAATAAAATECPGPRVPDAELSLQRERLRAEVAEQKLPDYGGAGRRWAAAVQALLDRRALQAGQPVAEVVCLLGPPSREEGGANASQRVYHWYFDTPMHVNPILSMSADGDQVLGFRMDRR
ncbi:MULTISPECIES: hypothetical protein [unclassified Variovorax]|uniref:hypothetical protein n=1 Tax=unclassified Variovorax TaxID=663243 RepID=UPI000B82A18B|nr:MULTISPECIES: hypothetical protein [unclassified Variovorax]